MRKLSNLSSQDIDLLKEWGYSDDDIEQINDAILYTNYSYNINKNNSDDIQITSKQARELLGNEAFISGISRSAFHWNSVREVDDKGIVYFDSERLLKKIERDAKLENEIIQIFRNEYFNDKTYGGMLPANCSQLEKYSSKMLNNLCECGILQKRNCDGLAYEFNPDYLNNVVIPERKKTYSLNKMKYKANTVTNTAKKIFEGLYEIIPSRIVYDERSHSDYIEYMHFNCNNGTVIYKYGLGISSTPEIIPINEYQDKIIKYGINKVSGAKEFDNFVKSNPDIYRNGLIANAKEIIKSFLKEEYDQEEPIVFNDVSKIDVAYTTLEDNEDYEIQVSVDLINCSIDKYCNDTLIESDKYNSLSELISSRLETMNFDDLVYVDEEKILSLDTNEPDICE